LVTQKKAQKITILSMFNTLGKKNHANDIAKRYGVQVNDIGQVVNHNNVGIINNEGQRAYIV